MSTTTAIRSDIANPALASEGKKRIEWAARNMPVLAQIKDRFAKEKPFTGIRIAACMHVTTETANLMLALKAGGADLALCASNPLSTQDDTAAALVHEYGISVFARNAVDRDGYYGHLNSALDIKPQLVFDDGCDLVNVLHTTRTELIAGVMAGCEETTTGVIRLSQMAKDGALKFPMIAVNDTDTKHMFDNRYGTGQSTFDAIFRATNTLVAGKIVVVAGFGYCGKGVAERAKGLGAEAVMDFVAERGTTAKGLAMTRNMGTYYVVGYGEDINVSAFEMITTEKNIVGNLVGTWAELTELMSLADRGKVHLSTQEYSLANANQALQDLNNGKVKGRAVLIP